MACSDSWCRKLGRQQETTGRKRVDRASCVAWEMSSFPGSARSAPALLVAASTAGCAATTVMLPPWFWRRCIYQHINSKDEAAAAQTNHPRSSMVLTTYCQCPSVRACSTVRVSTSYCQVLYRDSRIYRATGYFDASSLTQLYRTKVFAAIFGCLGTSCGRH